MSDTIALDDPTAHGRALEELAAGRLVVAPTDTVYVVIADAFSPAATRRLLRTRGSGRNRPLPVLIARPRQLNALSLEVGEAVDRLVATYWPGPLTIIVRSAPGMTWDLGNSAGTVALRMPDEDWLLDLGRETGPLAGSGAFRRGQPPTVDVAGVREQFGESVALYVDGGTRHGQPSTIVDASRGEVEVLREGAVPAAHVAVVARGELGWGERPEPVDEDATGGAVPSGNEPPENPGPAGSEEHTAPTEPVEEPR